MSISSYPAYIPSKIKWLDVQPSEWKASRLKYLCDVTTGDKDTIHEIDGGQYHFFVRSPRVRGIDVFTHDIEAVLTPGDGDVGKVFHYVNGKFSFHQRVYMMSNFRKIYGRYFFYYLSSLFHRVALDGTAKSTVDSLRLPTFLNFEFLIPKVAEQQKIAQFLDYETAKIDALIDEQKRLIDLLKEKRQAVISHAVTKGLNPDAPMKDSAVEWLGQVPEHWKITPIKHVTKTFEQGWSPQCFNEPVSDESELGVLKVGCVRQGRFEYTENKRLPPELKFKSELAVRAGDLLISRANTRDLVGSAGVPTVNHDNLMISDKLFRLRLTDQALSRFVCFFLTTKAARQQIELAATGASDSMLNIGQGTIKEMPFPCPPFEEQHQIVDHVVRINWQLLELAGEALKLVDTLKERRSALISAAVTGKIDVRDWQPPAGSDTVDSNASVQTERHYG